MRGRALLWLLLLSTVAFAGCTDDAPADDAPTPEPLPSHPVTGRVMTPAFNPIEGARVWIGQSGSCTTEFCTADLTFVEDATDATGAFRLPGIWEGNNTTVHVEHPDYEDTNVTVTVPGPSINLTLTPVDRVVPYQQQFPFNGYFECGADHLIFAGSCDEFAGAVVPPAEGSFADEREFTFSLEDDWKTVVVDIHFDPLPPTLEALRLAAYDAAEDAELGAYPRYTFESGAEPFTLRIEPGTDYGDDRPTPENATDLRLEVFPQGHGYHQVCDPSGETCFTGVGASARVDFQVVATAFYHEAAPQGWTLLDD